jgi:outer membrane biosynthesis protein TonB
MGTGHALRLTGANDSTLVAYVQPAIPRPFVNPLRGLPWLVLVFLALFSSAFLTFVFYFAEMPESADFTAKNVNPVAVKLIAPPKPEEKKKLEKLEKKIERAKKKPEKELPKVVEKSPVVPQETKKALKSIEKLSAAGPALKDLLAAVDKLGSGPGAKNARNDFKLSDLIGKAPIASAGLGTFGLGGGGGGGMGIKGAELLRGKGGLGIGALGAGRIGKGAVAGTVTHAVSRNIGAQGSIDKEAVAKVINSHLHEVSSCYERALLKTPGLAGKIVLEWQITTAGLVGYAKTKSSTMQSPAVESCILAALKTWRFPPAKGAGVIITYPFMFNSVGY